MSTLNDTCTCSCLFFRLVLHDPSCTILAPSGIHSCCFLFGFTHPPLPWVYFNACLTTIVSPSSVLSGAPSALGVAAITRRSTRLIAYCWLGASSTREWVTGKNPCGLSSSSYLLVNFYPMLFCFCNHQRILKQVSKTPRHGVQQCTFGC